MQRAVSVSKLLASTHLAHIQENEVSRLRNLLPPGLNTVLNVDLARLLVKARAQRWRLAVPSTLVSLSGSGAALLSTAESGLVEVTGLATDEEALIAFEKWLRSRGDRGDFPVFVHKKSKAQTTFHKDPAELREVWSAHRALDQTVQQYVVPPSSSLSLLRAHWQQGKKRTVYYLITLKPQPKRPLRRQESLPSLAQHLSELRKLPAIDPNRQFAVSGKASSECWALKQIKPIPAVDEMLAETRKLLETVLLRQGHTVQEVVCDFIPNQHRKWVLLDCKGLCFRSVGTVVSQKVEWKQKIDIKFILFPLFDKREQLERRIRAANHMEDTSLNSLDRRISILGMQELKRQQEEASKHPLTPARRISFLYTPLPDPNPAFTHTIKRYDDLVKSIKRFKQELTGKNNYCEKYGGKDFWAKPVSSLQQLLTGEVGARYFYDQMSREESGMMARSFERVLEGDYGLHYRQAIRRIHANKGIRDHDFRRFLRGMEKVLLSAEVSIADCNIILRRFSSFEREVCTNMSIAK